MSKIGDNNNFTYESEGGQELFICSKCGRLLPLERFHLSKGRRKSPCIECKNEAERRRSEDPYVKLTRTWRVRLRYFIDHGGPRGKELTGCNREELIAHIESGFKNGMGWANYGRWHVDHIIPCSAFDLTDEEQVKRCFHYTNLQPLWADENNAKRAKWDKQWRLLV